MQPQSSAAHREMDDLADGHIAHVVDGKHILGFGRLLGCRPGAYPLGILRLAEPGYTGQQRKQHERTFSLYEVHVLVFNMSLKLTNGRHCSSGGIRGKFSFRTMAAVRLRIHLTLDLVIGGLGSELNDSDYAELHQRAGSA